MGRERMGWPTRWVRVRGGETVQHEAEIVRDRCSSDVEAVGLVSWQVREEPYAMK